MRKTNTNLKRMKIVKQLIVLGVIQVVIIVVFAFILASSATGDVSELKTATITVDKIAYEYEFISGRMFSVFSDSVEYCFPKIPVAGTDEFSMIELRESITIGENLTVEYTEKENYNVIIGAYSGNEVLRSAEAYYAFQNNQFIMGIVTFGVVEIIFLAILIFFVFFHQKELKFFTSK